MFFAANMSDSEISVDSGESTRFSSDEDTEEAVGLMVAGKYGYLVTYCHAVSQISRTVGADRYSLILTKCPTIDSS